MPAEEVERRQVDGRWLLGELRADPDRLVLLDCRSSVEYAESHIRHALNFSIPSIMLRRLAAGKIDLVSTIKCKRLKERIVAALKESLFVLYGEEGVRHAIAVLADRLVNDGCRVVCVSDGFSQFRGCYPEWCESLDDSLAASDPELPLMGLRSLRISTYTGGGVGGGRCLKGGGDTCSCEPKCDPPRDAPAPPAEDDSLVEILPHLFLGNAANSEDLETLTKHSIKYILNVTPDLPNVFEPTGEIKYMKIPIADHWSQNLASYFPKAIEFIDEARGQEKGVLVHCVAGVSRSVTVTLAYLMARLNLSLNDAFSTVRARKPNIAPNFHFMEQLLRFEQELRGKSEGTFLSPVNFGQSPDSGIEFDRWTPGTGE